MLYRRNLLLDQAGAEPRCSQGSRAQRPWKTLSYKIDRGQIPKPLRLVSEVGAYYPFHLWARVGSLDCSETGISLTLQDISHLSGRNLLLDSVRVREVRDKERRTTPPP